jgi:hypothetical protein
MDLLQASLPSAAAINACLSMITAQMGLGNSVGADKREGNQSSSDQMGGQLAGYLLQIVGVLTGSLTLLDWSLTITQKARIKDWSETAWIWLGEQKTHSYLTFILSDRTQKILSFTIGSIFILDIAGVIGSGLFEATGPAGGIIYDITASYIFALLYIIFLHKKVMKKLVDKEGFWKFGLHLLRLILIFWLVSIPFTLIMILIAIYSMDEAQIDSMFPLAMLPNFIVAAPVAVYIFLLIIWGAWLLLIVFLMGFFRTSEFVMLRVASYEKGPVLGLSAALFALGLIVRPLLN